MLQNAERIKCMLQNAERLCSVDFNTEILEMSGRDKLDKNLSIDVTKGICKAKNSKQIRDSHGNRWVGPGFTRKANN